MTKLFHALEESELDQEQRLERYQRGRALICQHGLIDLNHQFQVQALASELNGPELEDYIFAVKRDQEHEAKKTNSANSQPHTAKAAPSAELTQAPTAAPTPPHSSTADLPDEQVRITIDHFAEAKKLTANQGTVDKYVSQCRLFLKIIADGNPDMTLSEITISRVQTYARKLNKIPKKVSPNDPRSIDNIIASSTPRMAAKTKFAHAQAVNMFLDWCQQQQYRIAPNLGSILAPSLKKPKADKRRKYLKEDELKLIFESKNYQQKLFTRDSDYWLPILGLLTGARQAELCQLLSSDIRQDPSTSLWYIDINDDGDKRLKTDESPRQVPIHPELERLRFLAFANSASTNPGTKLFPGETRNARGEFGAYSKRFNRYREAQGIKNTETTYLNYHSLRHTLQNDLLGRGFEQHVLNDLVGHTQAERKHPASAAGATCCSRVCALRRSRALR